MLLRSEDQLVREILRRERPSEHIVHIDLGFWQSLLPLIRLSARTNVFTTVHTGLPRFTGVRGLRWKIKGKVISGFSNFHLLASNANARESLRPYITAAIFDQVEVAYSGFDPAEIERAVSHRSAIDPRAKWGLPDDRELIITVGQFIERKGCWILLDSLRQLKNEGHSFTFLWLSTTLPEPSVTNRIEQYGMTDSFRVMAGDEIGETRDDLFALMSCADIFVLASLQEGLPIALVEAMALGLPCIATDVNAMPEAIENGINGILVPSEDPTQLAEAIADLLHQPKKRQLLGAAAKRVAFEKFDEHITAERTLKLYDAVWKTSS
jgi:glycosyltransferase involved in cell wall biosynthesis